MDTIPKIAEMTLGNIQGLWTFILLICRFFGLLMIAPGIGLKLRGAALRTPAIVLMALVSTFSSVKASIPANSVEMMVQLFSEILFGYLLGVIAFLVVVGVQSGAQVAGQSMGLGAAQLIDPTTGGSLSSPAIMQGDLVVILFLLSGGHYTLIRAASGLGSTFAPGAFHVDGLSVDILVNQIGQTFTIGIMVAAPVVTALLLTQFVMGLLTKAVPQLNAFIVSYPLTLGVGLVLTSLALPEVIEFVSYELAKVDGTVLDIISNVN